MASSPSTTRNETERPDAPRQDPEHPIIERPWQYELGTFHYHVGLDGTEPHIDLDLHRDGVLRRLRSWSPRHLRIEEGFPLPTHGMAILDVRARGLDGLGVQVIDFESSEGGLTFWARDVADRDGPAVS